MHDILGIVTFVGDVGFCPVCIGNIFLIGRIGRVCIRHKWYLELFCLGKRFWRCDQLRVAVLVALLLVVLSNGYFLKRLDRYGSRIRKSEDEAAAEAGSHAPRSWPFVSVLVPARNEEGNIERCVASLVSQKYPRFEMIVLDDDSTDGTLGILHRLALSSRQLRVLSGRPLPPGWLGKHWARTRPIWPC